MKKLFCLLFVLPLFVACSSDDSDDEDVYISDYRISGEWYSVNENDSITVSYGSNIESNIRYERDTKQERANWKDEYKLTDTHLVYLHNDQELFRIQYRLYSDSLSFFKGDNWVSYKKIN